MKILITGAAGFIGYNLSKLLLKKKHQVFGIDNFDDYYSIKFKKKRILLLKKHKNFNFKKIDITKKKKLNSYFRKKKFNLIIHLAAQAGVRFSMDQPGETFSNNINGYINLLEFAKRKKIKNIIYASSSSTYGNTKNFKEQNLNF